MSNGYLLPTDKGLDEISLKLQQASEQELDELRGEVRIGLQWHADVTLQEANHKVSQAFLRAVRKLPAEEGGRTPAIASTAFARSEDRTRAMMAGFQVHTAKPIEAQELLATVGSLIGRTGD